MASITFLFAILFFINVNSSEILDPAQHRFTSTHASTDIPYAGSVSSDVDHLFIFNIGPSPDLQDEDKSLRVHVGVDGTAVASYPVTFVIRQQELSQSIQLPVSSSPSGTYRNASRTLCSTQDVHSEWIESIDSLVYVSVSSSSPAPVAFSLRLNIESHFKIQLNENNGLVELSPLSPQYFRFDYDNDTSIVLLNVTSSDPSCMTVSVQNASSCRVVDQESTVEYNGYWQTMSTQAGMTIRRSHFPYGFYVVFVMHKDDSRCSNGSNPLTNPRSADTSVGTIKRLRFTITNKITNAEYFGAMFGTFSIYALVYLLVAVVYGVNRRRYPNQQITFGDVPMDNERCSITSITSLVTETGTIPTDGSNHYKYNLITIALFYSIPVLQLVITYQKVLHATGNQDLCYYNFLCSHPFWIFSDFNHMYSNIGYIMLGLLFTIVVRVRKSEYPQCPGHYEILYAMGIALMIQGFLSGCYHVCPNHSNFQYDTCFMYVTAILCMLKIYQTRHPTVNKSAYLAFFSVAVVVLLSGVGLLASQVMTLFWILFTVVHFSVCGCLAVQMYYVGRFRFSLPWISHLWKSWVWNDVWTWLPNHVPRFVLILTGIAVNLGIAVYGIATMPEDFSTHLLLILLCNLVLYTIYYVIMKVLHKERILAQSGFYGCAALVLWAASGYAFFNGSTFWELSPAKSRTYNHACVVLNFYDAHDIWHLTSAFSMFFSFMVLLTLDDDIASISNDAVF